MRYKNIKNGIFIDRPNRFIARVLVDDKDEMVHVKNTGRCRELLTKGATVYLEKSENPNRKTKYDLIAIEKICDNGKKILINIDSVAPNEAAFEWITKCGIFSENATVKREVFFCDSRFDLYVCDGERLAFIEVKGVTLENNGKAMFPDAPTERGVKHLSSLVKCISEGYEAYVLFVIQMKSVHSFEPNDAMHKKFGDALRLAKKSGVKILARDCIVTPDSLTIDEEIEVRLFDKIIKTEI